jgi:hypothetical protein
MTNLEVMSCAVSMLGLLQLHASQLIYWAQILPHYLLGGGQQLSIFIADLQSGLQWCPILQTWLKTSQAESDWHFWHILSFPPTYVMSTTVGTSSYLSLIWSAGYLPCHAWHTMVTVIKATELCKVYCYLNEFVVLPTFYQGSKCQIIFCLCSL